MRYIPDTNVTIGHNVHLIQNQTGTAFHFETCSSKSLNFSSSAVTDDCFDTGCQKYYYNDIRIINPTTGHCLTARPTGNGFSALTPEPCNGNPTTTAQIFQTLQYVFYTPFYGERVGYGDVRISPYGYGENLFQYGERDAWVIGSDNKTLLVNPPDIGLSPDALLGVVVI